MAVYVDQLMHHGGTGFWAGKKSCHMFADTLEELHAMAEKIGMKRAWFQDNGQSAEHYDLVASRRALAIKQGAIELTKREQVVYFINLSRERRGQAPILGGRNSDALKQIEKMDIDEDVKKSATAVVREVVAIVDPDRKTHKQLEDELAKEREETATLRQKNDELRLRVEQLQKEVMNLTDPDRISVDAKYWAKLNKLRWLIWWL
ncbi:MAG TPA: DUF4031 domain-containing protein [Drouetiella sp.]